MAIELFFHFHGSLNDFLPAARKNGRVRHNCPATATVKDAIEAVGVPHAEVNAIRTGNALVGFAYVPQTGDRIEVFPLHTGEILTGMMPLIPPFPPVPRFVLDVHLGKLSRQLRMLGFDTLYERDYADDQIARISAAEDRIVLTRDIPLLKRNLVKWGYWLRSQQASEQLMEVHEQFGLSRHIRALYRCMDCNGLIEKVLLAEVAEQLKSLTLDRYTNFYQCSSCKKAYWKGSHYDRMQQTIEQLRRKLGQ